MRIIGIDPGLTGALAALTTAGQVITSPMPVFEPKTGKKMIDAQALRLWLEEVAGIDRSAPRTSMPDEPVCAFLERAQAMPDHLKGARQGSSSTFNYGVGFGMVIGVISALDIPYNLVMPGVWKKEFKIGTDKELARQMASRLFPAFSHQWRRKGDHGVAEAVLIAAWGSQQLGLLRFAA